MAIYKEDIVEIDIGSGVNIHRSFLNRPIGSGDKKADQFGIRVYRNGEAEDLTGVTVEGFFRDPQGNNIAITSGNYVSGNLAYVVLPAACYNYDGQFCLAIKLVGGNVTSTMRIVDGVVDNTNSDSAVAPTADIPTYQEILAVFDEMVALTAEVETALGNLSDVATSMKEVTYPAGAFSSTIGSAFNGNVGDSFYLSSNDRYVRFYYMVPFENEAVVYAPIKDSDQETLRCVMFELDKNNKITAKTTMTEGNIKLLEPDTVKVGFNFFYPSGSEKTMSQGVANRFKVYVTNTYHRAEEATAEEKNNMTMARGLYYNSSGAIATNTYMAVSPLLPSCEFVNNIPATDANSNALKVYVNEWQANGTFIGKREITGSRYFVPHVSGARMAIEFGRESSSGVTITDADIPAYLDIRLMRREPEVCVNGDFDFSGIPYVYGSINASTYNYVTSAATAYALNMDSLLKNREQLDRILVITANDERSCGVAFVTDNALATGVNYSGVDISAGATITVRIPEGTKHIIITRTNTSGNVRTPKKMIITGAASGSGTEERLVEIANYGLAFQEDYVDLSGYDSSRISSSGYNPAAGYDNKVTINKYIVADTVSYKAFVRLGSSTNAALTLGTIDAGYTSSKHATIVKFDFENAKVDFMTGASGGANMDGSTLPSYVYDTFALTNIDGYMYTVEIGRINRCPFARVWNRKTGRLCGEKVLSIYSTSASYGGKAGAVYDFPTFAALTSNVYFERIILSAPGDVFAAFVGDSITEGSQVATESVWANIAGEAIGRSLNCGRGGGNINHVQKCVDDILSVIKPKYVFVTIGTNGGNTATKLNNLIASIKAFGGTPVINCITRDEVSVEDVNNMILATNTVHCRFDIATSVNNNLASGQDTSLFMNDKTHPNEAGHLAMYNEFLSCFDGLTK